MIDMFADVSYDLVALIILGIQYVYEALKISLNQ